MLELLPGASRGLRLKDVVARLSGAGGDELTAKRFRRRGREEDISSAEMQKRMAKMMAAQGA